MQGRPDSQVCRCLERRQQTRSSLPKVVGPAVQFLGSGMVSHLEKAVCLGDATGARSGPFAKVVLYYKTHLALPVSGGSPMPTRTLA